MKRTEIRSVTMLLILALIFAGTVVMLPIVSAHDPPWEIPTWTLLTVAPNPVGVGQQAVVMWWLDKVPFTAVGAYGDRFTFTVKVTKPDGTTQDLGSFTSDPIGGGWTIITPDQAGTYNFQVSFPGHTLTGEPLHPNPDARRSMEFVGDYMKPSVSEVVELTVQQDLLEQFPGAELPTEYWTRPINAMNREWSNIGGNWLSYDPQYSTYERFNPYTTAPNTAHIMWTKPIWLGGIAGGMHGDRSYYTGSSYERLWDNPIIIQGRLYYNVRAPPRYGWYCLDLRTGEEIWFQNSTGSLQLSGTSSGQYQQLSFGQIYNYDSGNQHGTLAYLWSTIGSTWRMYDAFTGNWILDLENVPSGIRSTGSDGSLLIYNYNPNRGWLALWNSSRAIWANQMDWMGKPGVWDSNEFWEWRPCLGQTGDGKLGYEWNVTTPTDLPEYSRDNQFIVYKDNVAEMILGTSGCIDRYITNDPLTVYALSLKPGEEGKLLWRKQHPLPYANVTVDTGYGVGIDAETRVFCLPIKQTRQWMGFNLDTGEKIWGPTESQTAMDMYGMARGCTNADGKMFSTGFGGMVYAYDSRTGQLLWKWSTDPCGLESAYQYYPIQDASVADGKMYVSTGEHSHTQPLYRTWKLYCVDIETGEGIWNITRLGDYSCAPFIADGYAVTINSMDNQIYCFGKGPSKTTVEASPKVSAIGSSVMIEGTVTDESAGTRQDEQAARFPNGVPAISDEHMTAWMEYLYMQRPMPSNVQGVTVKLYAIDPNGNYQDIGETTSDMRGNFGKSWKPPVPGDYLVIAEFQGTESYYKSSASTYFAIGPTPSTAGQIETEPEGALEAQVITTELAIIIAAILIAVAFVTGFWILKKRK